MRQRPARERLDEDLGTPEEIERSLEDLWWINTHLGGIRTWRRLLGVWLAVEPQPVPRLRLLDVGCGDGRMAQAIAAELRIRGCTVETWGLDRRASHLAQSASGHHRLAGDAFRLPFADGSMDLVTCNLFLHHFHDRVGNPAATNVLREMARVARRAVLVNDLDRKWLAYLAIRCLGPRFSPITRHDGPRSVRQAYTARELAALGRKIGVGSTIMRLRPYRLGLIIWPNYRAQI